MANLLPSLDGATVVQLTIASDEDDGLRSVRVLVAQLPDPQSLPSGALIAVPDRPAGQPKPSWWRGKSRGVRIHRAARCTALLARGYVRVSAGLDSDGADWAWGWAP